MWKYYNIMAQIYLQKLVERKGMWEMKLWITSFWQFIIFIKRYHDVCYKTIQYGNDRFYIYQ
jgi:hypothetical protein